MTVYGGEKTTWGTRNGGFFVSCTKCGWHSTVDISYSPDGLLFYCSHCGNECLIK